jgi:hypothetical protein
MIMALVTCTVTAAAVLESSSVSPLSFAVTECAPAVSVLAVSVALAQPLSVTVPGVVVPSWKVTVPVGMPAPRLLTHIVAVKVIAWPRAAVRV